MAKKPTPGTSPSSPDELPEGRYSDRELSWLAFNERVLDLARDTERIPLLERAKFLPFSRPTSTNFSWCESPVSNAVSTLESPCLPSLGCYLVSSTMPFWPAPMT